MLVFREVVPLRRTSKFFCEIIDEEELMMEKVLQIQLPNRDISPLLPFMIYKNEALSTLAINFNTLPKLCSNPFENFFTKKLRLILSASKRRRIDTVFFFSQKPITTELRDLLDVIYKCDLEEYVREVGFHCQGWLTLKANENPVYECYVGRVL